MQLWDGRARTLEQLACRVYKQRLADRGDEVDDSTIYKSINAVKKWEKPLVEEEEEARAADPRNFRAVDFFPKNLSGTLREAERQPVVWSSGREFPVFEYLWFRKYPRGSAQHQG